MAKYVLAYHGGGMPETEEEQARLMQAWSDWLGSAGEKLIDGGAPIAQTKSVASDGAVSDGGGENPMTGYSLVSADSIDEVLAFAKSSPHLGSGGTIRVGETIEM